MYYEIGFVFINSSFVLFRLFACHRIQRTNILNLYFWTSRYSRTPLTPPLNTCAIHFIIILKSLHLTVNSGNQSNEFYSKYKDLTAKVLKQKLRKLKYHNDPLLEIKYVSRLLSSSLKSKQTSSNSSENMGNQDNYIRKNFWVLLKTF